MMGNFMNISHIIKILTAKQVFDEKIRYVHSENSETEFTNLFWS